jgi:signal transduction histidine kinase
MNDRRSDGSPLASLRGRLLFLICLATLPAVLFTFFAAANEREAMLARLEREALQLARLTSHEHAHQILGARKLLSWLGTKMTPAEMGTPAVVESNFLRALLAGHPQLANIGVLSANGQVVVSAYALPSYRSWKDNSVFRAALRADGVVTGTYAISPIFERPTLNHAFAVRDAQGAVTAVLFNGLDLEWLSDLARQSDLPEAFSLLIVDQEGRVLASQGPAGRDVPGEAKVRIPGVAELAQAGRGSMLAIGGTALQRYFVVVPLQGAAGLFVAVGLPYEQMLRQANVVFYRTLAGLGILTFFTIAAVFLAAELGLLRALRSLVRTVQRFGGGDLEVRVVVPRGHNELATLAQAFNRMADSLAHRHRQALEAQVELRALARRLHAARETEAARISRELHDEIGQLLTSLKIELSRLTTRCAGGRGEEPCGRQLQTAVESMNRHVDEALDFVRRISAELRPGVLDKLGLVAALEWQAREIEARSDLVVQVEADRVPDGLPEIVAVTLFRIAQEALTNVLRHASAHMAEVRLSAAAGEIVLEIRDDGTGIAPESAARSDALGILGMQERAVLVNGRFTMSGAPGQGTTVRVSVPVSTKREGDDAHSAGG